VPVRIAIDGNPGRPMIAGLSAHVKVDTKEAPLAAPASAETQSAAVAKAGPRRPPGR
jgi:multidrug resistance efflux pump